MRVHLPLPRPAPAAWRLVIAKNTRRRLLSEDNRSEVTAVVVWAMFSLAVVIILAVVV